MQLSSSDIGAIFESKAFKDFRAIKDAEVQRIVGLADRMNSMIQGLNTLIKQRG